MAREHSLSPLKILILAFLAQIAGHMLLRAYMPNVAIGGLGFLLVVMILGYVLFVARDAFGFILVVYICSHFSYADNQGGLWNLVTFGLLAIYLVVNPHKEGFRRPDYLMIVLLAVFIMWNIAGWGTKNPMSLITRFEGVAAFFGFILMFNLSRNMVITKERMRTFLILTFWMLIYQFVVALNQRYYLVDWNTPLIGAYTEAGTAITYGTTRSSGTLRHFELFGEYAVLLTCLFIPLLSSSSTQRDLRFSSNRIIIMIFICLAIVMLTSTRAAAILAVFVIASWYLVLSLRIFPAIDRIGRQLRIILAVAVLLPVAGIYVGLGTLEEDFADLANTKFTIGTIASGKAINRGELTSMALKRMDQESWWVGYGLGVPHSNNWAWMGVDPARTEGGISDFHSLYLCLPMIYGWIGTIAFLVMILVTLFRLCGVSLRYRRRRDYLIVLAAGFSLFWVVFLIDEFKISILRNPNYHMLFWIWLGLSNSIVRTLRYHREPEQPPEQAVNTKVAGAI